MTNHRACLFGRCGQACCGGIHSDARGWFGRFLWLMWGATEPAFAMAVRRVWLSADPKTGFAAPRHRDIDTYPVQSCRRKTLGQRPDESENRDRFDVCAGSQGMICRSPVSQLAGPHATDAYPKNCWYDRRNAGHIGTGGSLKSASDL